MNDPIESAITNEHSRQEASSRLVERVAIALWKASGGYGDHSPEPRVQQMYFDMAIAAIDAVQK